MSLVGSGGVVPALRFVTCWDRDWYYEDASAARIMSNSDLETGSESQVTLIVNNSRAIISRYSRASDILERSTFHDCTLDEDGGSYSDQYYNAGNSVGYSPGLLFAINTATAPGQDQSFSFNVALDVRWNVTFRNPKYGLSSAAGRGVSSIEDLKKEVVEDVKAVDGVKETEVLPDVESGAKKFDSLSDEEKAKIMELIGSMEDEKGAT
jgi:hypothetical protein